MTCAASLPLCFVAVTLGSLRRLCKAGADLHKIYPRFTWLLAPFTYHRARGGTKRSFSGTVGQGPAWPCCDSLDWHGISPGVGSPGWVWAGQRAQEPFGAAAFPAGQWVANLVNECCERTGEWEQGAGWEQGNP